MKKIDKLKKELNILIENETEYSIILKKSQEIDKYIVIEMKKMNKALGTC